MLPYVKVFGDLSATVDLLSDAEAGRLLKSLLHYINDREDELLGQEKLVFAMLKSQIDRDAASYAAYADKQRENGRKGGRPAKAKPFSENPKNPSLFSETQKSQEKEKEEEKDKEKENARTRAGGSITPFVSEEEADRLGAEYTRNMQTLLAALEDVGMKPTARNEQAAEALMAQYGTEKVLAAIDTAAEHDNRGGVSWAYLRRILENGPRQSAAGKPAATRTIRECCVVDGQEVWTERVVRAQ